MSSHAIEESKVANAGLFFRRWLANPLQMGSIIPSSRMLCQRIASHVELAADEYVLEFGAGTGVVTKAMIDRGIPPERIIVVEIVPEMAEHLRRALPGVNVICGDAFAAQHILRPEWAGRIGTAICGIPLVMLPLAQQQAFVDAVEAVAPGKGFLLLTYCITSPLPYRKLGLEARRLEWVPLNFPPASVWRYTPAR